MHKKGQFRIWLNNMWMEHKDDVYDYEYRDPQYDLSEYFARYKWWLKKRYKDELQNRSVVHQER